MQPPGTLSADVATDIPQLRRQIRSFLDIRPRSRILDLGCGEGADLIAIARERPGEDIEMVGIDASESSICAARAASGADERLSFSVADAAESLAFSDDRFDAVLSVNALEAFQDKQVILQEIHRVLRPGGSVVIAHFDWDSQLFDGFDKAAVRRLVHTYADWQQAWMADSDAWMGRRLWRTMHATRLFEGSVYFLPLINTDFAPGTYGWQQAQNFRALVKRGLAEPDEVDQFLADLEKLNRRGEYFYCITMFVYVGQPAT